MAKQNVVMLQSENTVVHGHMRWFVTKVGKNIILEEHSIHGDNATRKNSFVRFIEVPIELKNDLIQAIEEVGNK